MDFWSSVLCLPLLLLLLINLCEGQISDDKVQIRCHTCWTKENPWCAFEESLKPPIDCSYKDNVCKKIVTNSYRVVKRGQRAEYQTVSTIVSRLCGRSDWTGCRKTKGAASDTVECVCTEDGCNKSPRHSGSVFTILGVALAVLALLSKH